MKNQASKKEITNFLMKMKKMIIITINMELMKILIRTIIRKTIIIHTEMKKKAKKKTIQ